MSGNLIKKGSEAGAQTPPLLRASSPLKPKNQPRTNIETGTANGGTSGKLAANALLVVTKSGPSRKDFLVSVVSVITVLRWQAKLSVTLRVQIHTL